MFAFLTRLFFSPVDSDDPAWKPTGIRQVYTGYDYEGQKAFQETKRRKALLTRQIADKLEQPAADVPKIRRVR